MIHDTARIHFRHFELSDADDVFEYASDEETTRFLSWKPHVSREHTKTVLEKFYIPDENCYAIILRNTLRCIGSLTISAENEIISFGIAINKSYWGMGIGTEILKKAIEYAFKVLNADLIRCEHFIDNNASGKMMLNSGMECTGEGEKFSREVKIYEITKDQWKNKVQKEF